MPTDEPTARRPRGGLAKKERKGRRKRRRLFPSLDLSKTLFVVPNAITLAAIFCGFNAIRIIANASGEGRTEDFYRAAILLLYSMFFDLMDGRIARLTKTQSAFGLQMDSLADIVSFGVAPALLVHQWVLYRHPVAGLIASFSFLACAAIRLARFNVLTSTDDGSPILPGKYIVGLPSPPASGILIALVLANHAVDGAFEDPRYTFSILIMTVVLGFLMVSNVRFLSFKDTRFNAGTIAFILVLIGSSAYIWHRFQLQFVLLWLLSFYVVVGILGTLRLFFSRISGRGKAPTQDEEPAPKDAPAADKAPVQGSPQ